MGPLLNRPRRNGQSPNKQTRDLLLPGYQHDHFKNQGLQKDVYV